MLIMLSSWHSPCQSLCGSFNDGFRFSCQTNRPGQCVHKMLSFTFVTAIYYAAVLINRITGRASPSVCLSVCLARAPNSKMNGRKKQISVNFSRLGVTRVPFSFQG